MLRDSLLIAAAAATVFAWLAATVPPVVAAARNLRGRLRGAWSALALACGGTVLWTVVIAVALFVILSCDPRVAAKVLAVPFAAKDGAILGASLWGLAALVRRELPRLGDDFEIATALALVALVRDDDATLARVEALYRQNVVRPVRPSVRSVRIARARL
jgi:hypothetical protein